MSDQTEQRLTEALTAHLVDEGLLQEGEFVGDWISNVYLPTLDTDENDAYVLVMSGGTLPNHTAIGLVSNALDRLRGIGEYGGES